MFGWLSWEAASTIITFLAVLVALFQDKFWNWLNKPNPQIMFNHRRDKQPNFANEASGNPTSIISLAVQNFKDPIKDAKIFWVASEYRDRKDSNIRKERVVPEKIFEWRRYEENISRFTTLLYGEESFDFFISIQEKSQLWRPRLIFNGSENIGPFKEFVNDPPNTSRDPNYEMIIYLQIRGSNYVSDYYPVWLKHDMGTVGGWIVSSKKSISAEEFLERFPNKTEERFKQECKKFNPDV